ncbi:MAG: FAD-binding oxidoreductase [Parvibaculaceae bacterium]
MDALSLDGELTKARIDGAVLRKDHAEYDRYRRIWNGVADRRPAAIVRATNVSDVQKTVRIAAERGALIAVRAGGHSLPGFSTCDDGIVLDLSQMNAVTVDQAARTAQVMGGAFLQHLDAAGAKAGLVTPAGVVSHTGVAGLTLGGGMGWLSRRYGLSIDNLLEAELVTADGQVIHASTEKEPDLFWALRGGGGNFGVVTRFTFRMHPLPALTVGVWTYPYDDCAAVMAGFEALSAAAPRELTTNFSLQKTQIVVTASWSGTAEKAEAAISGFGRLAPQASGGLGAMAYVDLQSRSDEATRWGQRHYQKGGFLDRIDGKVIACMREAAATAPTAFSDIYILQIGGAVSDVDEAATAYSGRAAKYYWISSAVWDESTDDQRCFAWARSAGKSLAALSLNANYVNEQADAGRDIASGAYGPQKYERLARIKGRYDPGNLFRLNQNIEPKL